MTWETAGHFGGLVSGLGAAAAIIIGIRTYKRQTNAQIFLNYTARFQQVMASFPADCRGARLDLYGVPPKQSEELTLAVLRYLNLSSEEFYLCRRGYLAKDIWRIWEEEIQRTLRSPLFRREWRVLGSEFVSFPEFADFVERVQSVPEHFPVTDEVRKVSPQAALPTT